MDGWTEVGVSAHEPSLSVPAPSENKQYAAITKQLSQLHRDLLRLENEGKLANNSDVPGLAGEYQRKLRLNVNMLFAFLNQYIDVLSDLQKEYSELWDSLYRERLNQPKGTPNSAGQYADAFTKKEKYMIEVVKNRIQQIRNDYERYNGICISLQSTVKAEQTERIMG